MGDRKIDRIEYPMGTDASYIYYVCGCYAIGVGGSGSIFTDGCMEGHEIGGDDGETR